MSENWRNTPDLAGQLHELIAQIPAGRVTTCGTLAEALGNPIAARWVGQFTLDHDHTPRCPCHRVVRARGLLGPLIDGDQQVKTRRLAASNTASGTRFSTSA